MGICSSLDPEFPKATANIDVNDDVQKQLFLDELRNLYHFKVLVLGAGESGKSTVVKQLRFIHRAGALNEKDLKRVKETLGDNSVECLKAMVEACPNYKIELDDIEDKKVADYICEDDRKMNYTPEFGARLKKLWESNAIQEVFKYRDKYWLLDAVEYFMENITRFCDPSFIPEEEDVVMARIRTTGIVTTEFDQKNIDSKEEWDKTIHYQIIDVGGQRAERKKWMHCFDDVKAILFVVNMAGYNMVLFEDEKVNRVHEELSLFQETVNKPIFKRTPIFLFLNKKDLFEEKLRKVDLNVCFNDYNGGAVTQNALDFISKKFKELMPPENMDQYRDFYIASRVKRDVRYAFEDMQADLLKMNKKRIETETKRILKDSRGLIKPNGNY